MSTKDIARKVAIVGIGSSDYHTLYKNPDPTRTREEMAIDVMRQALDDCGLKRSDIDGLVTGGTSGYEDFGYRSGLTDVRYLADYPVAGRMCASALFSAAMAVHNGVSDYCFLFNSVAFKSLAMKFDMAGQYGGDAASTGPLYNEVYGMASPGALYALAFTRYQAMYGGTEADLGEIAVQIRNHGALNPQAIFQKTHTIEDYLKSRYIAKPLRLLDYCLVNDGCAGYIITSAERAKDLKQKPVYLASFAQRVTLRPQYVDPDFWVEACGVLKKDLFEPAGLTLKDIQSLSVYDNFSLSVLWGLEGFGFAPKGQGLQWLKNGGISLGGKLPTNTSGGMLAEAYLQGWNNIVEITKQLRGTADKRQIKDVKNILYYGLSAVPNGLIFSNEA